MSACLFMLSIERIRNLSTEELRNKVEQWKIDVQQRNINSSKFTNDKGYAAYSNLQIAMPELYVRETLGPTFDNEQFHLLMMREGLDSTQPALRAAFAEYLIDPSQPAVIHLFQDRLMHIPRSKP